MMEHDATSDCGLTTTAPFQRVAVPNQLLQKKEKKEKSASSGVMMGEYVYRGSVRLQLLQMLS